MKKLLFENQNFFKNNIPNQADYRFHGIDYLMQFQFEYIHLEYTIQIVHYNNLE
jgi:hypothetical protein